MANWTHGNDIQLKEVLKNDDNINDDHPVRASMC